MRWVSWEYHAVGVLGISCVRRRFACRYLRSADESMGVHGITRRTNRWVSTELSRRRFDCRYLRSADESVGVHGIACPADESVGVHGIARRNCCRDLRTNRWVSTELLALYMPAMSAVRHDVRAKAFYEALTGRGKKKIQAQCAVMRKYLVGIWACMQTQTTFDSTLLFSEKHLNH